eukprot:TRINITY_DN3364_c0_g1_i6.p1 TRINITY_DN3364_c0_g1~~TRINITY_DN3364_c0_g1_i6.p1  ORF type:complete len:168 (+),score=22.80 TRINITY_DN3364_c0_g1_i6:56-559(+)
MEPSSKLSRTGFQGENSINMITQNSILLGDKTINTEIVDLTHHVSNDATNLGDMKTINSVVTNTSIDFKIDGPATEILEQSGLNVLVRYQGDLQTKRVFSCKFSWDSKYLAYSTEDGGLNVINVSTGKNIASFYDKRETPSIVKAFKWRPPGAVSYTHLTLPTIYSV